MLTVYTERMTFTRRGVGLFIRLVSSRTAWSFIRRLDQWVSKRVMNLPQKFITSSVHHSEFATSKLPTVSELSIDLDGEIRLTMFT